MKISALDPVAAPDGSETVVVLKDGKARRATMGNLVDASFGPLASALAGALGNYRPALAGAVADFALGVMFASDETGTLALYRRIADAPGYAYFDDVLTSGKAAIAVAAAQDSATSAGTHATDAAAAAGQASGFATTAGAAAITATSKADAVSALLASFRAMYLGAFAGDAAATAAASANGVTLAAGAMYENTASGKFRVWSAGAWIDYDATAQALQASAQLAASAAAAAEVTAQAHATAAGTSEANAAASLAAALTAQTAAQAAAASAATRTASVALATGITGRAIDASVTAIITGGNTVAGRGAATYLADGLATAALAAAFPALCRASADGRYWRAALDVSGGLNVDVAGAVGDGASDDAAAIIATRDYVKAAGGGRVKFTRGRTYRVASQVYCGSNIAWDFGGATLSATGQITVFGADSTNLTYIADVPTDIWGPTNQLPVSTTAGLAVGDAVVVRLGNNPWDNIEPRWASTCIVLAIDAVNNILTLDVSIPHAIAITYATTYVKQNGATIAVPAPSTTATRPNRSVYKIAHGVNVEINDMAFQSNLPAGQSVEGVISIVGGLNITINRPSASLSGTGDAGAGLCGLIQFCRNIVIRDPRLGANLNGRNQGSLGRMFNLSNCINVKVHNAWAQRFQGTFAFIESFCEDIEFHSPDITVSDTFGSGNILFLVGQGSEAKVFNPTVRNLSGVTCSFVDSGGSDNTFTVAGIYTWRGRLPVSTGSLIGCLFDYSAGNASVMSATINGAVLTVASLSGQITPGARLRGPGVPDGVTIAPYATSSTTGTGGTGTYALVGGTATIAAATTLQTSEYAVVDWRIARTVNIRAPLYTGQYENFTFEGPVIDPTLYASAGVVVASLGLYLGYDNNNGSNLVAALTPGYASKFTTQDAFGSNYGYLRKLVGAGKALVTQSGAPTSGAFVGVSVRVGSVMRTSLLTGTQAPTALMPVAVSDTFMSEALLGGVKALDGFATLTPAALAAGAAQIAIGTVAVPNAAVGDFVQVAVPGASSAIYAAIVTAAGTVTLYASNPTAAAITPPGGEYRITGRKK